MRKNYTYDWIERRSFSKDRVDSMTSALILNRSITRFYIRVGTSDGIHVRGRTMISSEPSGEQTSRRGNGEEHRMFFWHTEWSNDICI